EKRCARSRASASRPFARDSAENSSKSRWRMFRATYSISAGVALSILTTGFRIVDHNRRQLMRAGPDRSEARRNVGAVVVHRQAALVVGGAPYLADHLFRLETALGRVHGGPDLPLPGAGHVDAIP